MYLTAQTNAYAEKFVRSDGTTLGADNGIGLYLALAAATQPGVTHGPLELLSTMDEESGMTGAKAADDVRDRHADCEDLKPCPILTGRHRFHSDRGSLVRSAL